MAVVAKHAAAGMTPGAQLHLSFRIHIAGLHHKFISICLSARHRRLISPLHVQGPRAVTCLATHIYLRPGGLIGSAFWVISFLEMRGMAVCTHSIPVLSRFCPVQPVIRTFDIVRRETVPFLFFYIPGNIQTLKAAAGKWNQILLKRFYAKRVCDFKITHFAVRTLGIDKKLFVLVIKT